MQDNGFLNKNKRIFWFAIIALLLGLNVFLWFMIQRMNSEHKKLKAETTAVENAKNNLQTAYNDALGELQIYEGENNRLDSLLNNSKVELDALKAEIQKMLNKNKLTTTELSQAKTMIVNLKLRSQNQVNTLDSLYNISQSLARTNIGLERDLRTERDVSVKLVAATDSLKTQYDSLNRTAAELNEQKSLAKKINEQLKQKNETLLEETRLLNETVTKAAMLKLENINFEGIRFKNNGKERSTKDYNKVERFKICYKVQANEFAQTGIKELYLKVVNPEGLVLYDEANDSPGYFIDENNEEVQYSNIADLDYKNDELQEFCTFSGFGNSLIQGVYEVQIFYSGQLVGMDRLELKNTLF